MEVALVVLCLLFFGLGYSAGSRYRIVKSEQTAGIPMLQRLASTDQPNPLQKAFGKTTLRKPKVNDDKKAVELEKKR